MRITDLPQAIKTAIDNWRLWVTLSLTATLIANETIVGIQEGQTIANALTRLPFYKVAYLLLVSSIISQAVIGAVPFIAGGIMTLYDIALARRRKWREEAEQARAEALKEGRAEGRAEGKEAGRAEGRAEARAEALKEGREVGREAGREALLRAQIAAVLDDQTLTPEEKNRFIAILNSATPE